MFSDLKPLEKYVIEGNESHKGRIVTSSTLTVFYESLPVERQCLGNFFIGYLRNDTILATGCCNTSPRWMQNMQHIIQDTPFTRVFIFRLLLIKLE